MSLSEKSDAELSELLTEYGIKHGPIVESTRRLYEKKLEQAMEEAPQNSSSDKTYYREEEVVTYITYHSPPRSDAVGDGTLRQRGVTETNEQQHRDEEPAELEEPIIRSSSTSATQSSAPSKPVVQPKPAAQRSTAGCLWSLIRLLLLFGLVAAVGYYLLCHVMSSEENQQLQ